MDEVNSLIVVKLGSYAENEGITLNSAAAVTVTAVNADGDVIAIGTAK